MILEYIMEYIRISLRTMPTICGWWIREKEPMVPVSRYAGERARGKKKVKRRGGGRKPVGRQWSVGTISADACSYAVRVLLSRAEIPAGFLRSLSSRAVFAERWNGGEQRMQEEGTRWEKGGGARGGIGRREEEGRGGSNQSSARGTGLPRHSLGFRSYEVVQLENQLTTFREDTSTAARIV